MPASPSPRHIEGGIDAWKKARAAREVSGVLGLGRQLAARNKVETAEYVHKTTLLIR